MDTFNGRTYYDNLAEYLRMELARLEVSPYGVGSQRRNGTKSR